MTPLWGGVECTVNRVHDRWFDQLERTGHDRRAEDLDRLAALGLTTLRYPVLWERVAPSEPGRYDWRWSDDAGASVVLHFERGRLRAWQLERPGADT